MVSVAWHLATRDRVIATPVEFAAGIAVGSLDGSLYAVGHDGVRLFETATGAPIRASALAANGGVVAANEAGDVLFVQRSRGHPVAHIAPQPDRYGTSRLR